MERCPSGHKRIKKDDGTLALYCTDCPYKFDSTTVLDSVPPAGTELRSVGSDLDRVINAGIHGLSINSVPVADNETPINGIADDSGTGSQSLQSGSHGQAGNAEYSPAQPVNLLHTSGDVGGNETATTENGENGTAVTESGHPESDIQHNYQNFPDDQNQTVHTCRPASFQTAPQSPPSSIRPIISIGSNNEINNSSIDTAGFSSIGDGNIISDSNIDSNGDVNLGNRNRIHGFNILTDATFELKDDNKIDGLKCKKK